MSKVGVGEPGTTVVSGRARDKSRFAGLLLLLEGVELMTEGRLESAVVVRVALVRSSNAWLPEAPAATMLIASSSLESSQFVLMTRPPDAVLGRGGVEVRKLVSELLRAWAATVDCIFSEETYGGGWPKWGVLDLLVGERGTGGRGMRGKTGGQSDEKERGVEVFRGIGVRGREGGVERLALRGFSLVIFLLSSRRWRSRSLRISTSIRHSMAFFTSSRAYTLTPSRLPATATRTPRCSMTTTLLKLTRRMRA